MSINNIVVKDDTLFYSGKFSLGFPKLLHVSNFSAAPYVGCLPKMPVVLLSILSIMTVEDMTAC
jgi:hypothetical protein